MNKHREIKLWLKRTNDLPPRTNEQVSTRVVDHLNYLISWPLDNHLCEQLAFPIDDEFEDPRI